MPDSLKRSSPMPPRKHRMARARLSRGAEGLKRSGNYGGVYSTLKRDRKKALGTKKPEEGSRKDLEQRLESLLAKRVKMRDGYRCRQCSFDGAPTRGLLDAGHIYPKGKFPGGKFLPENVVGQCRRHNEIHIARPEMMLTWYQKEHGPEALEELHALVLAQPRRQPIEWLRERIKECEEAIAEMELLAVA